ncbi:MAG: sulfatase-like hydrolase/transferase [Gemmatimonadales bacterium]
MIALVLLLFLNILTPSVVHSQTNRTPNVVLIVTDDAGYGDLGSYGATDLRTPHLDALARAGVRFTDFYANAPLCTPTRAALISGRYQQRSSLEHALGHAVSASAEQGLVPTGTSLPQLLKNHGYATALIGKWHLGYKAEYSPAAHGFDYFFGFKSGYVDYYRHTDSNGKPDFFENDTPIARNGYMTDLITERSVDYIRQHAKRPFFLEVAYSAPHWPYQPPDKPSTARSNARHLMPFDDSTSTRADYVAMVERADRGVGQILRVLDSLGLDGNTLVIFTNDNGGEWLSRNDPLFHRKWTLWEGGIRVPTIMRWPGRIPAGTVTGQVGITMDLSATILAAAGVPVPAQARFEGIDLLPIVTRAAPTVDRTLFWRTAVGGWNQRAVRSGDWKLLIDGVATFVYNVRDDAAERHDHSQTRQDVANRLRPLLTAWEADVSAEAKARSGAAPGGSR